MESRRMREMWWHTHHAACMLCRQHRKHFMKNTDANAMSECGAAEAFIANKNGFGQCVPKAVLVDRHAVSCQRNLRIMLCIL
jgi:hypothetical protein